MNHMAVEHYFVVKVTEFDLIYQKLVKPNFYFKKFISKVILIREDILFMLPSTQWHVVYMLCTCCVHGAQRRRDGLCKTMEFTESHRARAV